MSPQSNDDAALARSLGALFNLTPDPKRAAPPVATVAAAPPAAAAPVGTIEHEEAAATDIALADAGFGGALHTALGDLRRISDGGDTDVPPVAAMSDDPASRLGSGFGERLRAGPSAWAEGVAAWWSNRWREVLPGMIVGAVVLLAFVVVLATGGNRGDTRLDTAQPPGSATNLTTTTIGGITAASLPPDTAAPDSVPPGSAAGPTPVTPARPSVTVRRSAPGTTGAPVRRPAPTPPRTAAPSPPVTQAPPPTEGPTTTAAPTPTTEPSSTTSSTPPPAAN